MKRSLYLLTGVPLLAVLTACSSESDSDVTPTDKVAVQFRAADIASRAKVTTNDNITDRTFAVWGDMVSDSQPTAKVFDGTTVTYSGSGSDAGWKYDDVQYWMPTYTYSFVSLYPAPSEASEVGGINYSDNTLSFEYTHPSSIENKTYADATDLLIATHRRKYKFVKPEDRVDNKNATVGFKFQHILSRLDFVGNFDPASPAESEIEITSITLRGVGAVATFTITPAPLTAGVTETDDRTAPSLYACWSAPTATATIFEKKNLHITLKNAEESLNSRFFPLATDPLMVIPQPLTDEVEVVFEYTSKVNGNALKKKAVSKLMSVAVAAHDGIWLPGKSYTYNFTIGADEVIVFDTPVMEDWNESEGANFII